MLKLVRVFRSLLLTFALTLVSLAASAQTISVSGTVKDAKGEGIIGATIMDVKSGLGTVTGVDGAYTINVAADATLLVECMGYTEIYEPVANRTKINFVMSESAEQIEEIVMVGYGSQKKKEVTGAVASIKSEDFNQGVKTNPVGMLQGKVAGLNIIKTTSDPTSTGYSMQIRGFSTLDKGAGSQPLFIVDGVPVNNIDNISNDEIASMDVLKDGSAAAIYGTRGTNGVIIITTKRGENFSNEAKTSVEYSGYVSASVRNGDLGMSTADEFLALNELSGGKVTPVPYTGSQTYKTDWVSELCRPAAFTYHNNVAIVGSAKNFNYRASVTNKNAEGIAKVTNRNETMAKIAASQKALDGKLTLQYDLSYMQYRNDKFCGSFEQAATLNPTYPIYDSKNPNGYFYPQGSGESNPVENMNQKESYEDGNFFRGSVKASYKLSDNLTLNAFGAMEEGDNRSYWYNGVLNHDKGGSNMGGRNNSMNLNKLLEVTADYVWSQDVHSVTAVAGISYQHFFSDWSNMTNSGFPTGDIKYFQIGNGDPNKTNMNIGSGRATNKLAAAFGRVNYSYDGKYLVSASLRREGSSRFGKNNKWGWFPAISFGWRVNQEDFMMGVDWVDDLKVRLGYGVTGNDLGSNLQSIELLSNSGTFWYNGTYVYTYGFSQNANPDLKWEKKHEYNLGLDYAVQNNRFYGSVDVYYRHTEDLLWNYSVPSPPYQYSSLLANAGQMDSYGVELILNADVIKNDRLTWTTTPTIAFNRNYITKLSDEAKGFNYKEVTSGGVGGNGIMNTNTQIIREGEPVGSWYGYQFLGFDSAGTWKYLNPNNGKPVSDAAATESHRMILGNAQPLFTFGWNNTIRWKNFDATMFFRGVVGNTVLNMVRWAYGPITAVKGAVFMEDILNPRENQFGKEMRKEVVMTNKARFSDYYLEDGSYMKLDNITIGYNHKLPEGSAIESLRVYLTGQNLFTLTKYSGQDPEIDTTSVGNAGIDYVDFYPTVATFLVGVNLTFN